MASRDITTLAGAAGNHSGWGNVSGNDASAAYHGFFAYSHTWQNGDASADLGTVLEGWRRQQGALGYLSFNRLVVWGDKDIVAEHATVGDGDVGLDVAVFAQNDMFAYVAEASDKGAVADFGSITDNYIVPDRDVFADLHVDASNDASAFLGVLHSLKFRVVI